MDIFQPLKMWAYFIPSKCEFKVEKLKKIREK